MNYLEPYKIDNIDLNKINYTQIRHNKNKKIIFIKYKENEKLVFQIPTLLNIKKADIFTDYSEIEVALIGKNYTKINNMKNFFTELELKIKKNANENAHLWFNDLNTENLETAGITFYSDSNRTITIGNALSWNIGDTSKSPPSYSLSVSKTSVDEGSSFSFTIASANVLTYPFTKPPDKAVAPTIT